MDGTWCGVRCSTAAQGESVFELPFLACKIVRTSSGAQVTEFLAASRASARVATVVVALAISAACCVFAADSAHAATFNPELIISDANMRAKDSMSEKEIQAFLETQDGVLKSLVTPDRTGTPKRASAIIWDACQAWNISPRVMLAMLQKENSLIERPPTSQRILDRALGAGCPDADTNRYPGFGNQVWNSARQLDGYGEGKTTAYIPLWSPGMTRPGGPGVTITPKNLATYKLFVYNPLVGVDPPYGDLSGRTDQLRGNAKFWEVYWRYFGDPMATLAPPAESAPAPKPKPRPRPAARPAAPTGDPLLDGRRIYRFDGVMVVATASDGKATYRLHEPDTRRGLASDEAAAQITPRLTLGQGLAADWMTH